MFGTMCNHDSDPDGGCFEKCRSTKYRAKKIGSCARSGRQDAAGLILFSR